MQHTEVGEVLTLEARFTNDDGEPANPTTVTLLVTKPDASTIEVTTGDLTNPAVGHWTYDVTVDQAGRWTYRFQGAGAIVAGETRRFLVLPAGSPLTRLHERWCTAGDVTSLRIMAKAVEAGVDDAQLDRAILSATEFLHQRSRGRFSGLAIVELRPCCDCRIGQASWGHSVAWLLEPSYTGWGEEPFVSYQRSVADEPATCACSDLSELVLPPSFRPPVVSVLIDGDVFTGWALHGGRRLVRTDGDRWPCCQDLRAASTEDDTFAVQIIVGEDPSDLGQLAAADLSAEFYLYGFDPTLCRIPTKMTQITQQNQTITTMRQSSVDENGRLGLRVADAFLDVYGERDGKSGERRMRMSSPDVPPLSRRTRLL